MSSKIAMGLAAGLASGVGKGLVAQADAVRLEGIERARMAFQAGQAQMDRDFRSGQGELDRGLRERLAVMGEDGANRRAAISAGSAAAGRAQAAELARERMSHEREMSRLAAEIRAEETAAERAWQEGRTEDAQAHQASMVELQNQYEAEARQDTQEFQAEQAQVDRDFRRGESRTEWQARTGLQVGAQEFQAEQARLDREFSSNEATAGRDFTASENQRDRALTESGLDIRRDALALEYGKGDSEFTDSQGYLVVRRGDQATRVVGPDGSPIMPAAKDGAGRSEYPAWLQEQVAAILSEDPDYYDMTTAERADAFRIVADRIMGAAPGAPAASLPEPKTPQELAELPSGTRFRAPDGSVRVKP